MTGESPNVLWQTAGRLQVMRLVTFVGHPTQECGVQ